MGSAFYRVDVVYVRVDLLAESVIVLEGDVNRDDLVGSHAHGLRNELVCTGVEVLDELAQTGLRIEDVAAVHLFSGRLLFAVLVLHEFIDE